MPGTGAVPTEAQRLATLEAQSAEMQAEKLRLQKMIEDLQALQAQGGQQVQQQQSSQVRCATPSQE